MVKGYIYKFTNRRTNQSYIGKTFNLSLRYKNHIEGRGCTSKFNKALKTYGIESFTFEVLIEIRSSNYDNLNVILFALEKHYIRKFDSYYSGYNSTKGGEGTDGYTFDEETRELVRKRMTGRKLSEEAKHNISRGHLGLKHSEETKEKIKNIQRNRKWESKRLDALRKYNESRTKEEIMRNASRHFKRVIQYSIDGTYIKEWESIKEASSVLHIPSTSISGCCHGKYKTAGNYKWKLKED